MFVWDEREVRGESLKERELFNFFFKYITERERERINIKIKRINNDYLSKIGCKIDKLLCFLKVIV